MGPFEEQQPQLPQPQLQQPQEITLEDWEERVRSNYGIPQKLWRGMAEQESEGDVNAVSPTGVRGKWGMTRATAKIYNYNRDDPFEQAAAAGKHLRTMYDKLGHIKNDDARWWGAIASYYGGEGAVDRDGKLSTTSLDGISNPMEHVNRVAKRIQQFGETPASSGAPAQSLGQTPAQQPMKPVASPSVGRRLPQLSPERRKQQEDVLYEWAKATNPPNAQITEARRLLSAMSDQVFQQALKEGGKRIPGKVFRRATLVESLQSQFEPDGKPTEADRRIEQRRAERAKMSPFRRLYEDFSEGGAETINRVLDTASDTGESLARALTGDFGPVSEMGREALATTRATLSRLSRGGAAGMAAGPEYEKLAKQAEAEQAAKAAEVARQRVERQTALPGEAGQAARLREQMRQQVSESRAATPDMSGRIVRGVGGALADPVMLAGPLGGTRAMLAATALTQDPRDPAQALLNVGGAAASIGAARRVAGNVASRTAGLSSRAQTAAQMAAAVPVGSVTNIGQEAVGQALRGKFDPQQLVEAGVTGAILSGQDAAEIAGARRARNALVDPQRMALEDRGTLETRLRPSSPDTAKLQQPPAIGAQSEVEAAVAQAREAAAASGRPVEGKLWEAQERRIRESFGEAQAAQERAKLIEARLAELEQGQESGQPKPLSVAEQRQQERVRLFEVSRTIANRSLEQANAAMEAGDFIEAQAQLEGYRRALRDQSRYAPTDSPGARSQAAKEIARADTLAAKVKAQAAAQRRLEDAPTSGLPARRSRPTEQPQTEQPQSPGSSPLLGSVVNPEGGVPQAPEALSGRFGALVRQQTTQAASAPASRRKDTGELSPISYLKRKTGGEGIRVSDRGEAAVLGAREAGIVGLTNKRSRWTVNDAAVMLDEGGYTLPDGRAFTDPSVTENDVLAYLSGGGKQGRMNTTGLDQRLADEEAEYYARALEDQAPSQRFSETGALEELGDFFGAMARDETPRAGGIDPDLMSAYNKLDTDDPAEISQILRDADKRFKKSATIPERNASVAAFEKVRQLTIAEQEALSRVIPERVFAPVREGYQGEPGETYSRAVQDIPASEANAQLDKNLRDVLDFFDEMKASEAPETKKPPKFVEDAAQRLKDAASGKRAGSGGQQLADAAIVAGWRVYEAGMDFAEWSRGVISQLGDAVRPHLERAWQQLQRDYRRMASEARTPRSEPGDEPGLRIEDEMARLRTGKDSPVQLRQLRRRLPDMSKEEFDNAVMDLAESNRIVLHAHDFPASETPENLEQYVRSGDRYFTGAVFRSDVKPRRASILAALDDSSPFAARRAWVGVANSLERAGLLDYDDILVWDKDVREAGHSQKAIDAVWDVLAEIRADNYLSEAQVTFRPGGRNRPGYLYVNDAGAEMLRGAFDAADIAPPDFTYQSAVNADAEIMAMAANSLREEAQGSTIRPEEAEKLNRFADEIEKAVEAGGSSILPSRHMQTARAAKVAIRHETFHSSQRRVGDLHALTAPEWFGQHRYAERIGERLTQLGYPEVEHPAEAAAYIAGGEWERVGLNLDEATEFLSDYFDEVARVNGQRALSNFVSADPALMGVIRGKNEQGQKGSQKESKAETTVSRSPVRAPSRGDSVFARRQEGAEGETTRGGENVKTDATLTDNVASRIARQIQADPGLREELEGEGTLKDWTVEQLSDPESTAGRMLIKDARRNIDQTQFLDAVGYNDLWKLKQDITPLLDELDQVSYGPRREDLQAEIKQAYDRAFSDVIPADLTGRIAVEFRRDFVGAEPEFLEEFGTKGELRAWLLGHLGSEDVDAALLDWARERIDPDQLQQTVEAQLGRSATARQSLTRGSAEVGARRRGFRDRIADLAADEGGSADIDLGASRAVEKLHQQPQKEISQMSAAELRAELARLQRTEAGSRKKLDKTVKKLGRTPVLETISALRKAGLLTGVKTHLRNLGGNAAFQVAEEVSRIPAAIIDLAVSAGTGRRTITGASAVGVARSGVEAATAGLREAAQILRRGASQADLERLQLDREIRSGSKIVDLYIKTVFRTLSAEDAIFRKFAYTRALQDRAKAQALTELRDGQIQRKDVAKRTKEIAANPDEALAADALLDSEVATFNNENLLSRFLGAGREQIKPYRGGRVANFLVDMVAPFTKTPTNIVSRMVEYSPLGFGKNAIQIGKAIADRAFTPEEQRAFAQTTGRAVTGTSIIMLGYKLGLAGLMTGFADEDPSKRNRDVAAGRTPGAILNPLTNTWHQVSAFTPLGSLLAVGATLAREQTRPIKDESKRFDKVASAATQTIAEQPLLIGAKDIGEALKHPGKSSEKAGRLVGSFVPTIVSDLGELTDSTRREGRGFLGQIQRRTPIARNYLPPATDVLGRPLEDRRTSFFDPTLTNSARDKTQPFEGELVRHDVGLPELQRKDDETPGQFSARRALAGEWLTTYGLQLVGSSQYARATKTQQRAALESLRRQIVEQSDEDKRPDLSRFAPASVMQRVLAAERRKQDKEREARQVLSR